MDELVIEKLKAIGYKEVPKGLAAMLTEFKKRQDRVRPGPISLDAIVGCSIIYDIQKKLASEINGKGKGEGGGEAGSGVSGKE